MADPLVDIEVHFSKLDRLIGGMGTNIRKVNDLMKKMAEPTAEGVKNIGNQAAEALAVLQVATEEFQALEKKAKGTKPKAEGGRRNAHERHLAGMKKQKAVIETASAEIFKILNEANKKTIAEQKAHDKKLKDMEIEAHKLNKAFNKKVQADQVKAEKEKAEAIKKANQKVEKEFKELMKIFDEATTRLGFVDVSQKGSMGMFTPRQQELLKKAQADRARITRDPNQVLSTEEQRGVNVLTRMEEKTRKAIEAEAEGRKKLDEQALEVEKKQLTEFKELTKQFKQMTARGISEADMPRRTRAAARMARGMAGRTDVDSSYGMGVSTVLSTDKQIRDARAKARKAEQKTISIEEQQTRRARAYNKAVREQVREIKARIQAGQSLNKNQMKLIDRAEQMAKTGKFVATRYRELARSLKLAENQIKRTGNQIKLTNTTLQDMKLALSRARNALLLVTFAVRPVINGVQKLVDTTVMYERAQAGVNRVANRFEVNSDTLNRSLQSLTENGLISVSEASQGLRNLLSSGLNIDQATDLMRRFTDSAAFNRQGQLELGQAVVGATDGFKNQLSRMVDNAGVTKNLTEIIKEQAAIEGVRVATLSELEKKQITYRGLIRETAMFEGDASAASLTLDGRLTALDRSFDKLIATLGKGLEEEGVFSRITSTLQAMVISMQDLVDTTPQVTKNLDLLNKLGSTDEGLLARVRSKSQTKQGSKIFAQLQGQAGQSVGEMDLLDLIFMGLNPLADKPNTGVMTQALAGNWRMAIDNKNYDKFSKSIDKFIVKEREIISKGLGLTTAPFTAPDGKIISLEEVPEHARKVTAQYKTLVEDFMKEVNEQQKILLETTLAQDPEAATSPLMSFFTNIQGLLKGTLLTISQLPPDYLENLSLTKTDTAPKSDPDLVKKFQAAVDVVIGRRLEDGVDRAILASRKKFEDLTQRIKNSKLLQDEKEKFIATLVSFEPAAEGRIRQEFSEKGAESIVSLVESIQKKQTEGIEVRIQRSREKFNLAIAAETEKTEAQKQFMIKKYGLLLGLPEEAVWSDVVNSLNNMQDKMEKDLREIDRKKQALEQARLEKAMTQIEVFKNRAKIKQQGFQYTIDSKSATATKGQIDFFGEAEFTRQRDLINKTAGISKDISNANIRLLQLQQSDITGNTAEETLKRTEIELAILKEKSNIKEIDLKTEIDINKLNTEVIAHYDKHKIGLKDVENNFRGISSALRGVDSDGARMWSGQAQGIANVIDGIGAARSAVNQLQSSYKALSIAEKATVTLGLISALIQTGTALYGLFDGGDDKKSSNRRVNSQGNIGSTMSRGPNTININPSIIVSAEGDVLFSQDSIEAIRGQLIDSVQEAYDFGELTTS